MTLRLRPPCLLIAGLLLAGCVEPSAPPALIPVDLRVDGQVLHLEAPPGGTVDQVIELAGVTLGALDRVEPEGNKVISDNMQVRVVRVREEFSVKQEVIPFERKLLNTESLPESSTLLAQKGENGLLEFTYRSVYEDGVQVSSRPINEGVVVNEAVPEVIMVGIQAPFTPVAIPGRLVYLLGGNAWMMEGNTGNRRPIITSGDLDGRVFSLSLDSTWLLFTRRSDEAGQLNSLWAARIDPQAEQPLLVDLEVANVAHYAEWAPDAVNNKVVFSTVEARETAPGWQANNDLVVLNFSHTGWLSKWKVLLESNSGGVYGWWGTNFAWDPSGSRLAYARPDSVGLVDLEAATFQPLLELIPVQTGADWAWVPWISWSPTGGLLFTVDHVGQSGSSTPEESPLFDLSAVAVTGGGRIPLVSQTGMFAYPVVSPLMPSAGENEYRIAYLQAIFPTQSETSRYRLAVIDRDGSDQRQLFPAEGQPGLEPHRVAWSPAPLAQGGSHYVVVIYEGNLWLVETPLDPTAAPAIRQITGDGLASRVLWGSLNP